MDGVSCSQWMKPGESRLIPLGVCIEFPKGYEAIVAPKSSAYKKYGVMMTNSIGVIDESYCGNNDLWYFPAYSPNGSIIKKNDRICQFRIIRHQPDFELEEVDELGNKNRGGIGSTGVN